VERAGSSERRSPTMRRHARVRSATLVAMRPSLLAVAVLLLAACPAAIQAPPAFKWTPDVKPSVYFPLALNTAWSYNVLDPSTGQSVLLVNRVQARDGNRAIIAVEPSPLAFDDLGDSIITFPSRKPVLKVPIAKGATWPLSDGIARILEVDAVVEAPAGRYASCVAVEESTAERRVITTFAPHVGPVKVEIYAREGDRELLISRALLRSYHDPAADSASP
jgi:hypothetical protein